MRKTRTARKVAAGFTLIEVLVVVAIIALLVSILLPSLQRARQQATAVVCRSNLKQIMNGMLGYQLAAKGYMPHNLWSEAAWYVPKKDLWFYKLKKELPDPKVWVCPGDPFRGSFDFEATTPAGRRTNQLVNSCGYGMNYLLRHMGEPESFNVEYYHARRPANTILLAEVGPDDKLGQAPLYGASNGGMGQPWRDGGRLLWDDGKRDWFTGSSARTWLTGRHYGNINMAAIDGHIQFVNTVKQLTTRIRSQYTDCQAGGCYWCVYDNQPHYNFAPAKLYWWTGPVPDYPP